MRTNTLKALQAGGLFLLVVPLAINADDPRGRRRAMTSQPTTRNSSSAPAAGEKAPHIKLKSLDGKQQVKLFEKSGKRPVILFFGSYT